MKKLMIFSGAFRNQRIAKLFRRIIKQYASKDTQDRDANHVITFQHHKEKCKK